MKYLFFFLFSVGCFSQQIKNVDFVNCKATVFPDAETKSISGKITYDFKVIAQIDSIRIDAKAMEFSHLTINNKVVGFINNGKELVLYNGFKIGKNTLEFEYSAKPKQTLYFTGRNNGTQVWTQGQGKYTSHWLPSFDDVNEKVVFSLSIKYPDSFIAISNGILKNTNHKANGYELGFNVHNFEMCKPMSSYLVMFAIGDFTVFKSESKSKIPLENYLRPEDVNKYEFTYKASDSIFNFLEKEIGFAYPWKIYRNIPVKDFLYAGMENTTSTLFSQDYVVDEYGVNDRNYVNVNAHELAHQWFGDLVTAKSGKHHWLQEGFATYYALLAEKKVFGDDYFNYQLYKNALFLDRESKTDTIPILNEKASSFSFYQKGAWALHTIREEVGAEIFQKIVASYLKKYKFQNVETSDFLNEVKLYSDFDTEKFQKTWLEDYNFPIQEVNAILQKSNFISDYLKIVALRKVALSDKKELFKEILQSDVFHETKIEIVNQLKNNAFADKKALLAMAMQTKNLKVRNAVAENFKTIPADFKTEYESLLSDKSYETQQTAFVKLYSSFPESQKKYLEIAQNWEGNSDKELRITFLTAYLFYKNGDVIKKQNYFQELLAYTSANYESKVRQIALENMLEVDSKNLEVLYNLVNATTHHKWQFVKFGRDTIRALLKDESYFVLFKQLIPRLNTDEKFQLERLF
jgi:aminopeptidase N